MFCMNFTGKVDNKVSGNFKTFSYTGTGSSNPITTLGFQPDLVTIFAAASTGSAYWWPSMDSSNGAGSKIFDLVNTDKYVTDTQALTSFDPTGFTLGTSLKTNKSGNAFQAFCWKKAANFFDVQTFTGNATNRLIPHNLTSTPQMMILFDAFSGNSVIYHAFMDIMPQDVNINWSSTGTISIAADPTIWNNTSPTSGVFSLGTSNLVNANANASTAYLFGASTGFSAFGNYTGNGSTSGPSVNLGFAPSLVMICQQDPSANDIYWIYGNTAEGRINQAAIQQTTNFINLTGTGFTVVTANANFNTNGTNYFYSAWL